MPVAVDFSPRKPTQADSSRSDVCLGKEDRHGQTSLRDGRPVNGFRGLKSTAIGKDRYAIGRSGAEWRFGLVEVLFGPGGSVGSVGSVLGAGAVRNTGRR